MQSFCLNLVLSIDWNAFEGTFVDANSELPFLVATVYGAKSALLKGERIALNLFSRACAIATEAFTLKQAGFRVAGSRKTTPGFRLVEKYALMVGSADTHRYDATSCLMIKDNHIDAIGGSIREAVRRTKMLASFTQKIEVECRRIEDAIEAAESGADIVMIDNFLPEPADLERLSQFGVAIELSGGFTPQNLPETLKSHTFSMGYLTHSAPIVDFSLKIVKNQNN